MNAVITTERCFLRQLTVQDAVHFYELNNDPEVLLYTGDAPFPTLKDAEDFLSNYNPYAEFGFGRWAVIDKESQAFLGWCGLKQGSDENEVDLGFRFYQKHWNQGYATETSTAIIEWAFQSKKLPRLIGRAQRDNQSSIRVLEKLGFVYEFQFDFDGTVGIQFELENTLV